VIRAVVRGRQGSVGVRGFALEGTVWRVGNPFEGVGREKLRPVHFSVNDEGWILALGTLVVVCHLMPSLLARALTVPGEAQVVIDKLGSFLFSATYNFRVPVTRAVFERVEARTLTEDQLCHVPALFAEAQSIAVVVGFALRLACVAMIKILLVFCVRAFYEPKVRARNAASVLIEAAPLPLRPGLASVLLLAKDALAGTEMLKHKVPLDAFPLTWNCGVGDGHIRSGALLFD